LEIVKPPPKWRTLLVLGRVSNLPTVWSNCLAGWWLGGGGRRSGLFLVIAAATSLYIGGMFLNDAFDADFDRHHRRLRPIPSAAIGEQEVWRWGGFWLALGVVALVWAGWATAILSVALVACILVYNASHKMISFGPVLMGLCRFLVYLVAATAGAGRVTGRVIWPALALAIYVAGLSCLARKESGATRPPVWPVWLLAAPLALSALFNDDTRWSAALLMALMAGWVVWSLAQSFWREQARIGATVSRLLAGIALVDWLAASQAGHAWLWNFPVFFAAALFLQRFVPAT
jgi:4-hydroxybenzoate polyprenyltransferase